MKISFSWLQQFLDINETPQKISTLLTDCGLEVEHLQAWQSIAGGLQGVVTGEVLTCIKHPNADRLNITTVDTGDGVIRQIVCGAPNVAAGQKVIVALPGAKLFPTKGEPFEIKKSKIRGENSEGMICAEDEIGLGESHAGIMILPENTVVGTPAGEYFSVSTDFIFEIGLTPNRADAASHLGVSRDLKALLGKEAPVALKMPDISNYKKFTAESEITVDVRDDEGCIRYSGLHLKNIIVKDSPLWLKNRLKSIGIRPINNIVDITNYIMHDLGQPLHAFDADKIQGNTIIVGSLPTGTLFTTLDNVERKLNGTELMISDEKGGLCIAGVFGGVGSGVTENTTSVFLESACFNPVRVRKSAKAHSLHTDSSFRFERGTDPEMTVFALQRAAVLIQELADGVAASEIIDIYPVKIPANRIYLSFEYLKSISGDDIPRPEVIRILKDLQIAIVEDESDWLLLEVPAFKVDVTRPADIVEEILRIYGYNTIGLPKKMSISLTHFTKPDAEEILSTLSGWLVDNGFNEILTNSLTKVSNLVVLPTAKGTEAVQVLNPLSSDLGILRHQMMQTGLESIAYNINRRQQELRFFETGKTYLKAGSKYIEQRFLSIWITGARNAEFWKGKTPDFDIYYLKSVIFSLLESVGIKLASNVSIKEIENIAYSQGLSCEIGGKLIAQFGVVGKNVLKSADISQPVLYAEIHLAELMKLVPVTDEQAPEPPKFPEVRRDLSMLLDRKVNYAEVEKIAFATEPSLLRAVNLFDVYEGEKIGADKKSYALSFILRDNEATLQDKKIDTVMEKLMAQFEQKLGAIIRRQ
ncbi:phenylalanine--tRNA ligase subunit beta [soil metagenome]